MSSDFSSGSIGPQSGVVPTWWRRVPRKTRGQVSVAIAKNWMEVVVRNIPHRKLRANPAKISSSGFNSMPRFAYLSNCFLLNLAKTGGMETNKKVSLHAWFDVYGWKEAPFKPGQGLGIRQHISWKLAGYLMLKQLSRVQLDTFKYLAK